MIVPKSLNSYALPDNIIVRMKDNIEHSRRSKKELGFSLCASNSDLHDESQCVGTLCHIQLTRICKSGQRVGGFHTHPGATAEMSIGDMYAAYKDGISCIGGIKDNKIRCYVRKGEMDHKTLKIIKYEIPRSEGGRMVSPKRFREYEYVRSNLQRNLFDTVGVV